jgi:hypothetical protein
VLTDSLFTVFARSTLGGAVLLASAVVTSAAMLAWISRTPRKDRRQAATAAVSFHLDHPAERSPRQARCLAIHALYAATAGAGIDHSALLGGRNRPDDPDPLGLSTAGSTQPTRTAHLWLAATGGLRSAHRAGRLHRAGRALSRLRPRVHHLDGYRSGIDDSGLACACLRIAQRRGPSATTHRRP